MKKLALCMVAATACIPMMAVAQRQINVNLGPTNKKTVEGSVTGRAYVDYLVKAGAGQSVAVKLRSNSRSVNFNFNPPKSSVSMFIGSTEGNRMDARMVPMAGSYIVRVYQMGAARDEEKTGRFSLEISISGRALKPLPNSKDARLRGTPFHATAPVKCMLAADPQRTSCEAFVIRYGDGSATVEFRAGQTVRRVLFVKGKPAVSDSPLPFTYSQKQDEFKLRFGDDPDEEYTLVEALIFGG